MITDNRSGGVIHYIAGLANALAKEDDVTVLGSTGMEQGFFRNGVTIVQRHLGATVAECIVDTVLLLPRGLAFLRAVRAARPDVIHIQLAPFWIGLLLPFLKTYPIITTIHDIHPHPGSRPWDQILAKRRYLRYSDAVIVHGEWARRELPEDVMSFVVPMGNFSLFSEMGDTAVREEPRTILFFGRIEDYKGLGFLLDAMPAVVGEFPDTRLVIAGSGDMAKYRKRCEAPGRIEVHNRFIPETEVAEFFQRAGVVVLPYIEGTQTGVVPIAYSFRRPVIVTAVGSIPELVEDGVTGFIVPPGDPGALAAALIRLFRDDRQRREMGEAGYRKGQAELSWEEVAWKTRQVYRQVIEVKHAGG